MFIGNETLPATFYRENPVWIPSPGASFNPADYGTPILYLDADDVSGSAGSNVSTWPFNTYGADAVYTTGTNPTKENGPNSHFAVQFGGAAFLTGNLSYSGTNLAVVSVLKMNSGTASFGRAVSVGVTGSNDYVSIATAAAILRDAGNNGVSAYRAAQKSIKAISLATWSVVVSQWDGTNNIVYVNGSAGTTVASSGTFSLSNYRLGQNLGTDSGLWNGQEACVIVYSSLTDRAGLTSALSSKYGI